MASITNLGSVSGLPLEKILTDLAAANDKALQRYDTRATSYQARINATASCKARWKRCKSPPPRWASRRPWPP